MTPEQRFLSYVVVDPSTGCHEWQGFKTNGYGRFGDKGKHGAHRWSYAHWVGPIPEGMVIDHICRNRGCVNPAHLEPVTNAENIRRGFEAAPRPLKSHCKRGHERTPDNVGANKGCKQCVRERRSH